MPTDEPGGKLDKEAGLVNHGRRRLYREAVGRLEIAGGMLRWTFSTHRLETALPVPSG